MRKSVNMPRPVPITIIAAFLFLATAIAAAIGASLLFPNPLMDQLWQLNKPAGALFFLMGPFSGLFLLALGGATFAAARALLRGRRWAWWFAVALFAVDGAGDLASFFLMRDASYFLVKDAVRAAAGALVSSIFIYLLCRRDTRVYFLRNALTPNHNA